MNREGPRLESLLHRLTQCPAELHQQCGRSSDLTIALVADLLRSWQPTFIPTNELLALRECDESTWGMVAVVVWLLKDDWFSEQEQLVPGVRELFASQRMFALAGLVRPEVLVGDPDRREELVRLMLAQLDLRPAGETLAQANDRLMTLDSVERRRILEATLAAEKRAREVREAMAKARAQESASRYGE